MMESQRVNDDLFGLIKIQEQWKNRVPGIIEKEKVTHSSVLVPLIEKDGQIEILFQVRSAKLHRQPSEVCFPGGGVEDGESFVEAAIRETVEELKITGEQIEVLAPLDYLELSSGLTVHAYLGMIRDYDGTYSEDEVDHVFTVPLSWFLNREPELYQCTVHTIPNEDFPFDLVPGGHSYQWRKGIHNVYFYRFGKEIIWGMTAKILYWFIRLYKKEVYEDSIK